MSRRTCIRRFEVLTGISPGEWVLQERTAPARNLLEASGLSVAPVATAVGFGSADVLRHRFRTRLDTSPARYPIGCRMSRAAVPAAADVDRRRRPSCEAQQIE